MTKQTLHDPPFPHSRILVVVAGSQLHPFFHRGTFGGERTIVTLPVNVFFLRALANARTATDRAAIPVESIGAPAFGAVVVLAFPARTKFVVRYEPITTMTAGDGRRQGRWYMGGSPAVAFNVKGATGFGW